jgi:hypothetical protein
MAIFMAGMVSLRYDSCNHAVRTGEVVLLIHACKIQKTQKNGARRYDGELTTVN